MTSEDSGVEIAADRDAVANFIGMKGDIFNGSKDHSVPQDKVPD